MNDIRIGKRKIGPSHRPFIISEMSGNHDHSLEKALAIVEAAARAGADALKLQTYTADTMTLDLKEGEFYIDDPNSLWKGTSLYQLYEKASTPWEWHAPIFKRCRELGMIGFSTPFDETAVDFLESLNAPAYKIASFENGDHALIRKVASLGKPLMISTGMATVSELSAAVTVAREAGCKDLILLKCTSAYPARAESANLRTLRHMQKLFSCQVGLSDHTEGIGVAVASVGWGASVIEKHITLSRLEAGVDSAFSMEPHELKALVKETERAWQAMGKIYYGPTSFEKPSLQFRRSLYIVKDMKGGERLSKNNLRAIRPGLGLPPKYYETLLGKRIKQDVKRGTPMTWELLE